MGGSVLSALRGVQVPLVPPRATPHRVPAGRQRPRQAGGRSHNSRALRLRRDQPQLRLPQRQARRPCAKEVSHCVQRADGLAFSSLLSSGRAPRMLEPYSTLDPSAWHYPGSRSAHVGWGCGRQHRRLVEQNFPRTDGLTVCLGRLCRWSAIGNIDRHVGAGWRARAASGRR